MIIQVVEKYGTTKGRRFVYDLIRKYSTKGLDQMTTEEQLELRQHYWDIHEMIDRQTELDLESLEDWRAETDKSLQDFAEEQAKLDNPDQ